MLFRSLELDDRFVICPSSPGWDSGHLRANNGRPVTEGFRYASDGNPEWLDADALAHLLAAARA